MELRILIPTLLYHSVDGQPAGKNITTSQRLIDHLEAFLSSGYRTVSLDEYIHVVRSKNHSFQEKLVLLTFDDGYEDFYTEAWPILKKYNATASVFLITSYIGQLNWWNYKSACFRRHLSWEQIIELQENGISFGGHSTNHHSLMKFDKGYVWHDMTINKSEIEYRLENPIKAFSYPYGDFSPAVKEAATIYFDIAFSSTQGTYDYRLDPYAINRFNAQHPKYTAEHLIEIIDSYSTGEKDEFN